MKSLETELTYKPDSSLLVQADTLMHWIPRIRTGASCHILISSMETFISSLPRIADRFGWMASAKTMLTTNLNRRVAYENGWPTYDRTYGPLLLRVYLHQTPFVVAACGASFATRKWHLRPPSPVRHLGRPRRLLVEQQRLFVRIRRSSLVPNPTECDLPKLVSIRWSKRTLLLRSSQRRRAARTQPNFGAEKFEMRPKRRWQECAHRIRLSWPAKVDHEFENLFRVDGSWWPMVEVMLLVAKKNCIYL